MADLSKLADCTITVVLDGVTHTLTPTARESSNGNPMLFAVAKLTGDGSDPQANRYQANVMLTLIDDSPEAIAARAAKRTAKPKR
jgi:hypothetical protein